ncbi:hypothetical protein SBOR_6458 [Sclerotinia borealis F-4128]|uniref:Piwi domain-containing protein n=1 Tax=Sclerotinia borealis (strain F-4128) TaxID=1432307 RepID=W9CEF6_SCLBF|nr:hypothetical protein SBOR_6458 [Sclerotinia borealis F-4128]
MSGSENVGYGNRRSASQAQGNTRTQRINQLLNQPRPRTSLPFQQVPGLSTAEQKIRDDAIQSLDLPKAPQNLSGEEMVKANYFKVTISNKVDIRKYRISLGQVRGRPVKKRESIRALIENILNTQHKPRNTWWTSDYHSYIIATSKLYDECSDAIGSAISITHTRSIRPDELPEAMIMKSTLFFEGFLQRDSLIDYTNTSDPPSQRLSNMNLSKPSEEYLPLEDLRILNLISWESINCSTFKGGRVGKKFYPTDNNPPEKILNESNKRFSTRNHVYDVRMGFFTSMHPGMDSVLLNVSTTTTAFLPPISLQTWLDARWGHLPSYRGIPLAREKHEIKGVHVTFDLDDVPNRILVISDVNHLCVKGVKWEVVSGKDPSKTVWQHMKNVHTGHTMVFDENASCINVGNTSYPKWLPADHLHICEWQTAQWKLDNLFTAQMLKFAKKTLLQNQREIIRKALIPLGMKNPDPNSGSKKWVSPYEECGMKVEERLLEVTSKHLLHPSLTYNSKCNKKLQTASWNLVGVKGFNVGEKYPELKIVHVTANDFIAPDSPKNEQVLSFAKALAVKLKDHGLGTQAFNGKLVPTVAWPTNDKNKTYDSVQRRSAFNILLDKCVGKSLPSLLIVVLPSKDATIYSDVKWWGDCHAGIATVCVGPPAVKFQSAGLLSNLSLKVNFKLGGINHVIGNSENYYGFRGCIPTQTDKVNRVMIVGADVSHAGKGPDTGCPSMAGIVASFDNKFCHYAASSRIQANNEEFISDLGGMLKERLAHFYTHNKCLPAYILFYRDGMSESQFGMVHKQELPQIQAACEESAAKFGRPNFKKFVTLVVVIKRHHTRFFPLESKDQTKNIAGGLVVDKHITAPNQMSFFLQSHESPLGTARSAHYTVISNEGCWKWKP